MFDDLEDWALEFLDHDPTWWPFLFMRPPRHERIRATTTVLLAALYGTVLGLALDILFKLAEQPLPLEHPAVWPLITSALMFAALQFPLAWAWNRRAVRSVRKQSWSKASRVASSRVERSLTSEDAESDRNPDRSRE